MITLDYAFVCSALSLSAFQDEQMQSHCFHFCICIVDVHVGKYEKYQMLQLATKIIFFVLPVFIDVHVLFYMTLMDWKML